MSFTQGLLDCPHYPRPEVVDGTAVPSVLLGGNHAAIRRWRLQQALGRTWLRRPELLAKQALDQEQRSLLDEFINYYQRTTETVPKTVNQCFAEINLKEQNS